MTCPDCNKSTREGDVHTCSPQVDRVGVAVYCTVCGHRKKPIGRSAPLGVHLCREDECDGYWLEPMVGSLWPGEKKSEFGYPCSDDGTSPLYETAAPAEPMQDFADTIDREWNENLAAPTAPSVQEGALEQEREKFRAETLRTSAQAVLLQRWMGRAESLGCRHEQWTKACDTCDLMRDTKALLYSPINVDPTPSDASRGEGKEDEAVAWEYELGVFGPAYVALSSALGSAYYAARALPNPGGYEMEQEVRAAQAAFEAYVAAINCKVEFYGRRSWVHGGSASISIQTTSESDMPGLQQEGYDGMEAHSGRRAHEPTMPVLPATGEQGGVIVAPPSDTSRGEDKADALLRALFALKQLKAWAEDEHERGDPHEAGRLFADYERQKPNVWAAVFDYCAPSPESAGEQVSTDESVNHSSVSGESPSANHASGQVRREPEQSGYTGDNAPTPDSSTLTPPAPDGDAVREEWRVSKSGYSIRTGWGDEKRIIAQIPATTPKEMVQAWIDAASDIVEAHNKSLSLPQPQSEAVPVAITFTANQLDDILGFMGGEDGEVTVSVLSEGAIKSDGEMGEGPSPAGLWVHMTDYPEEGATWLGEAEPESKSQFALATPPSQAQGETEWERTLQHQLKITRDLTATLHTEQDRTHRYLARAEQAESSLAAAERRAEEAVKVLAELVRVYAPWLKLNDEGPRYRAYRTAVDFIAQKGAKNDPA